MLRQWTFGCALLFILTINCRAHAQSTPAPPATPLTIFFTASAPDNSPLAANSLRVTVDKKPAQVLSLRPGKTDKLLFALLVDVSGSQKPHADAIRQTTSQIFQELTSQGAVGYFGTFADRLRLSNAPILASGVIERVLDGTQFSGGTSLYDAIAASSRVLSGQAAPAHRVIIVITDGDDDNSDLTLEKLVDAEESEGIAIFSLVTPKGGDRWGRRAMKVMGEVTGGVAILPSSFDAGVAPLLTALNHQWELTIAAPAAHDGKLHQLTVHTSQKHIRLSAPDQIELP